MTTRRAEPRFTTKETGFALTLNIDGAGKSSIQSGIPFSKLMMTLFARQAAVDLKLICKRDLALCRWSDQEAANKMPDLRKLDQIAVNLSHLEEVEGNLPRAILLLEFSKKAAPHPEALQRQIDELKQKLAARPPGAAPQAR